MKEPTKNTLRKKPKPGLKSKSNLPPLAYMLIDTTGYAEDAKIIRIIQLTVFKDGESDLKVHYFNNGDQAISEEATKYHGITEEMLKDKPDVSTFNFNVAKNIAVWDGQVAKRTLKKNGITKHPVILNLHSLARYLETIPKPIKLNEYALKVLTNKKVFLEFQLKKAENKIDVLPQIFEVLRNRYMERYGENSMGFMVLVGMAHNQGKAFEKIKAYLAKKEQLNSKKPVRKKVESPSTIENPKKKVIVVNASASQNKQGVKSVVIKKRV